MDSRYFKLYLVITLTITAISAERFSLRSGCSFYAGEIIDLSYEILRRRLGNNGIVILDGGTGTELEKRGVSMDPEAWCGIAALESGETLQAVHEDYIAVGADVITANTYATSRLLLEPAGYGHRVAEINSATIKAACRAREASGKSDVMIAGSLSHRGAAIAGTAKPDPTRAPSIHQMEDAFRELANILQDEGCDLILLEMMYYPERMKPAFTAACETKLPVWAGFSARRGPNDHLYGFAPECDIPIDEIFGVLRDFDVAAAGVMHTEASVIADTLEFLSKHHAGPYIAYPDSGYFKSPSWQFKSVMPPHELHSFASQWIDGGVQIVGGCCGLSPDHISALEPLKH